MSTELAQQGSSSLAIAPEQEFWNEHQIAALRQLGVTDATNGDLAVFFHQCARTGLDPFARQIYMIGRKSKGEVKQTIQTGIDGFRLIASRTGLLDGYEDTLWCGNDGVWRDVWLSNSPPAAAKVTVIRRGARFPAVALFREYAQTTFKGDLTQMWREKGALMIAKCAEAQALRKAFPQDLSGLYTADEMGQADNRRVESEQVPSTVTPQPTASRIPADLAEKIAVSDDPVWLEKSGAYLAGLPDEDPATVADLEALIAARLDEIAAPAVEATAEEPDDEAAVQTLQDVMDADVIEEPAS